MAKAKRPAKKPRTQTKPWRIFHPGRAKFSDSHRVQLAKLGLSAEQIEELADRLPVMSMDLHPSPRATPIKQRLRLIKNPIENAQRALALLKSANDDEGLYAKLILECGKGTNRLTELLTEICAEMNGAIERLGRQSRLRSASPYVIKLIVDGLSAGQRRREMSTHLAAGTMPADIDEQFPASRSGPFREVARICYEAAQAPNSDPERAIKSYLEISAPTPRVMLEPGLFGGFGLRVVRRPGPGRRRKK